jgi:hypothetical protein
MHTETAGEGVSPNSASDDHDDSDKDADEDKDVSTSVRAAMMTGSAVANIRGWDGIRTAAVEPIFRS